MGRPSRPVHQKMAAQQEPGTSNVMYQCMQKLIEATEKGNKIQQEMLQTKKEMLAEITKMRKDAWEFQGNLLWTQSAMQDKISNMELRQSFNMPDTNDGI